jgi:hypothetical protein
LIELLLPSKSEGPVHEYFANLRSRPTPRSLRMFLELVHIAGRTVSIGDLEPATAFGATWRNIHDVLAGALPPDALSAFGAGYWALISGDAAIAVRHLQSAAASDELATSFDARISLARALYENHQSIAATQLLRTTCRRLIANAHATMKPALISITDGPHADAVNRAIERRTIQELADAFAAARRTAPNNAEMIAREIWLQLVSSAELPAEFDATVKDFLEALADEEDLEFTVTPALYSLAAQLSFACGDTARGRAYLIHDVIRGSTQDACRIERSWAACVRGNEARHGDAVIDIVGQVMFEVTWRRAVDDKLFEMLWRAFRALTSDWRIAPVEYRIVSPPPASRAAVELWATVARAKPALPYDLNTVPPEASEAAPTIASAKPSPPSASRRVTQA